MSPSHDRSSGHHSTRHARRNDLARVAWRGWSSGRYTRPEVVVHPDRGPSARATSRRQTPLENPVMLGPGLWIAAALTLAGLEAPAPPPPRSVTDPRLVLEQIAKEPEIVTPTGLAVDPRGRVLVIESHTHFRPKDYKGPPADRIRLFEDAERRRPVRARRHVLRGDEADDEPGVRPRRLPLRRHPERDLSPRGSRRRRPGRRRGRQRAFPRRSSGSTRRATTRTTGSRDSRSTSPATSTSAWARTSARATG